MVSLICAWGALSWAARQPRCPQALSGPPARPFPPTTARRSPAGAARSGVAGTQSQHASSGGAVVPRTDCECAGEVPALVALQDELKFGHEAVVGVEDVAVVGVARDQFAVTPRVPCLELGLSGRVEVGEP